MPAALPIVARIRVSALPLSVLASLCALAPACRRSAPADAAQATPGEAWLTPEQLQKLQISLGKAEVREVGGELVTSGRIAFDDLKVAHVFSPVSGRVTAISANLGQRVARGAPLARIRSPDLGSALSDVGKAQADLTAAGHELRRQRELFAAHAGSQRDLETAEDNERKARAELVRAEDKAKLLHGGDGGGASPEFVLRAPIAGEVIARNVNPGTDLQGQFSGGTSLELFTVGDTDVVWVLGDVFEVDLPQLKLGAPVDVSVVAFPERKFQGRVDWISGALDPVTRTARVRCTVPNPQHELRPEMFATLSIGVTPTRALAVPRDAVLRLGDQTVVFVQTGHNEQGMSRFARRVVKIDESVTGAAVPIVSGLQAGDTVVVSGGLLLSSTI